MSYALLILGVLLWSYSHLMKRVTPAFRESLGDNGGKGLATALTIAALVLMVIGYRGADPVYLYEPPAFLRHVNNLLMLVAVYLLLLGYSRGVVRTKIRHPMLNAVKTWAIAHLLVNGTLADLILFGGLFAWALFDMIKINRMTGPWQRPAAGPVINDAIYAVGALVVFAAIGWLHGWLGPWPFG